MKHYTPSNYTAQDSVGFLVTQLHLALRKRMDEELAEYDLTAVQWIVLRTLVCQGHRKASDLAETLNHDAGAMTRLLDRLEAKGLVRRVRSQTDRRVVELALTDAGNALAPQLLKPAVAVLNDGLKGFTAEELLQFKDHLRRMTSALGRGT